MALPYCSLPDEVAIGSLPDGGYDTSSSDDEQEHHVVHGGPGVRSAPAGMCLYFMYIHVQNSYILKVSQETDIYHICYLRRAPQPGPWFHLTQQQGKTVMLMSYMVVQIALIVCHEVHVRACSTMFVTF